MRTTTTALLTLFTAPLALATPQSSSTIALSPTLSPPQSYYLKTRVIGHDHHDDKDGLYVTNFHTGMRPRTSLLSKFFLYKSRIKNKNK